MHQSWIPNHYQPILNIYERQCAIADIKQFFQNELAAALNLRRVSAPLFLDAASGLNDDLTGHEEPVSFVIPAVHRQMQIVHSLAKWKRLALKRYGFPVGSGLYTDMNAIRTGEMPDNIHSVYVDQWDWETVILKENRTIGYLQETVKKIVSAICNTYQSLQTRYPKLSGELSPEVTFITAQELADRYPGFDSRMREAAFVKEHHTACILQIGGKLRSGEPHDLRAPDYDDWNLNCDIFFWNPVLEMPMEISSMGIRVDETSLETQLKLANCQSRKDLPFHKMLLAGELPLTIGGGIGQSRLCMLMLGCAHIGEVQVSVWDRKTIEVCKAAGVQLL